MKIENTNIQPVKAWAPTSQRSHKAPVSSALSPRRDTVTMTGGRKQRGGVVDALMKQRTDIQKRKDDLISSTKENGGSMDSIKSQLDSYQKQLEQLDEQISEAMVQRATKQLGEVRTVSSNSNKPKTRQDVENKRLANIVSMSVKMDQAETVSSARTKLEGNARVLESEIKMDQMHGASEADVAAKQAKVDDMMARAGDLVAEVGDILAEVQESATEQNEMEASIVQETSKEKNSQEAVSQKTTSDEADDVSSETEAE